MRRSSPKPLIIAAVILLGSLVAVVGMTWRWLLRDRAELQQRFSQERLALLDDIAQQIEEDMRDIADDLRFVGQLVLTSPERDDRMHVLQGLLGAVNMYHTAALYDARGQRVLLVTDPLRNSTVPREYVVAMDDTAHDAVVQSADMHASVGLPSEENGWFRVFSVPIRAAQTGETAGAIAVLIDTRPLFASLKFVASEPGSAILVLGPHGNATPSSTPSVVSALATNPNDRPIDAVTRMRRGERGTIPLGQYEASRLGAHDTEVLAAFVPIRTPTGQHWSIMNLSSMARLRSHEELLTWRFASVASVLMLLCGAFAVYYVVASRRNLLLRERLRHADEVAQLNEQLLRVEKLTTVGVLAAGIAHEIGTPLGVVRGRAEYLRDKLEATSTGRHDVDVIIRETDYVSRTIRELLDFARPQPAEVKPVDLTEVLDRSVELMRYELEHRQLNVTIEPVTDVPQLAANADQLQQVIVNLLMNAMDACQRGGRISIRAGLLGDSQVTIEVTDNGCGIPADDIRRVFDPFFTTKKRGQGTGLGLSVVMKVVRAHGADIDIRSRVGDGTTARLIWPVNRNPVSVLRAG